MEGTNFSRCYCHDLIFDKCVHCQDAEDRRLEDKVCSSWNWECSPREAAEQASNLGWSMNTIVSAMKRAGFKQSDIDSVVHEFERLG